MIFDGNENGRILHDGKMQKVTVLVVVIDKIAEPNNPSLFFIGRIHH